MTEKEWDDFFDNLGPGYDEVMKYGTKTWERERNGRIAQIWEYDGKKYGMVWDKETGHNLRYDDYDAIIKEREERKKKANG